MTIDNVMKSAMEEECRVLILIDKETDHHTEARHARSRRQYKVTAVGEAIAM